jgi:hypothetical protein
MNRRFTILNVIGDVVGADAGAIVFVALLKHNSSDTELLLIVVVMVLQLFLQLCLLELSE